MGYDVCKQECAGNIFRIHFSSHSTKRFTPEISMHAELIRLLYNLPKIMSSDIIISASSFPFHRIQKMMLLIMHNNIKIQFFSWLITKRISFLKVSKYPNHDKLKKTVKRCHFRGTFHT